MTLKELRKLAKAAGFDNAELLKIDDKFPPHADTWRVIVEDLTNPDIDSGMLVCVYARRKDVALEAAAAAVKKSRARP